MGEHRSGDYHGDRCRATKTSPVSSQLLDNSESYNFSQLVNMSKHCNCPKMPICIFCFYKRFGNGNPCAYMFTHLSTYFFE